MKFSAVSIVVSVSAFISGCSSHPLVDDVTRKNTVEIVQAIRCEARKGLLKGHPIETAKEAAIGLGYDFTFDITETNNASGGELAFTNVFSAGKAVFNFSAGAEKTRQSERYFRVIESLKDLRHDSNLSGPEKDCGDRANLLYPIGGSVGADEFVATYLSLSTVTKLDKYPGKGEGIFLDTLKFTTDFKGGFTPDLTLNTPAGGVRLTKAKFEGSIERKDIHTVTMALANVPVKAVKKPGSGTSGKNRTYGYEEDGYEYTPDFSQSGIGEALNQIRRRDNLNKIDRNGSSIILAP